MTKGELVKVLEPFDVDVDVEILASLSKVLDGVITTRPFTGEFVYQSPSVDGDVAKIWLKLDPLLCKIEEVK